jgi:chromosomal replication initiator protein
MQGTGGYQGEYIGESSWKMGLSRLESELDPQIYAAYIKPLRFSAFNQENSELLITAPSKLVCKQVDEKFRDRISAILAPKFGVLSLNIRLSVDDEGSDSETEARRTKTPYVVVKRPSYLRKTQTVASPEALRLSSLDAKYTFANFVVGSSNQFSHAAAMRVAEAPGKNYNPLFIYGGVGLGKTHLLHAIGNAAIERNPSAKVLYMSSESFTNELIQSLRLAKMDEFKNRLRSIEVLLIDDIQFICGKERTQEEFFHTFNALYGAKNQIVITSDKIPQDIPGIEERLRTRFSWGLIADLQAPDFETRVAILKRKALIEGISIPEEVMHLVAERVSSNVRSLEGALTRLHAVSSLQNKIITRELALSTLKEILEPRLVIIGIDDIKKAVATHFSLKASDLISKRRTRNVSFPRHVAMYLCRKHTTASYPEIGHQFGGRDHSSVIHAANVICNKTKTDPDVKNLVEKIERQLLSAA